MSTRRAVGGVVAVLLAVFVWGMSTDSWGTGSGADSRAGSASPSTAVGSTSATTSTDVPTPTDEPGGKPLPDDVDPETGLAWVAESELPAEALDTLKAVDDNGPFPYDRDGAVFENREGLLPAKAAAYYAEFTVETPGSGDRRARRIVKGEAGEFFYTDDHYESFERIAR